MCWQLLIPLPCGHIHADEISYCPKNPEKRDEGWVRYDPKTCPQWRVISGGEESDGGELGPVKKGELEGICGRRACVAARRERKGKSVSFGNWGVVRVPD
jgi:hypothetical protein